MIAAGHREYATAWSENAEAYAEQGVYDLLADQLFVRDGIGRILDIGCGLGHGLAALRHHLAPIGGQIFAIDENPECLAEAAVRLDIPTDDGNLDRIVQELLPDGRYRATYRPGSLHVRTPVMLVQSDLMLHDAELSDVLDAADPLDAVTLWFSGVHKARSATALARHFELNSDAEHRMQVEDLALDLAAARVRPGGCLQIVVRGAFPSPQTAARHMGEAYSDALADHRLMLETVAVIRYCEPDSSTAIKVRSQDQAVDRLPGFAFSLMIVRR